MKESEVNLYRESKYLLPIYNRLPLKISYGKGVYLYTEDGTEYLDFFSGLAVNALGYSNDKVIEAIENQLRKYIHISNYYVCTPQVELAKKLVNLSGLSRVFFSNSGTEATEASLKLIRKVAGPEKKIITFSNAFHGRTYGSMSLGGKDIIKQNFSPLLPNIIQLEFNDLESLDKNIAMNTAAVYLEFIQGEGGVRVASNPFIEMLKSLREKYNFILVADEVQTGIGRTGKAFAFNHYNLTPDLLLVAKAIGGGLPLGALIVNQQYENVFNIGDHGSTFGGNPVACAAGLEVLNQVFRGTLLENVLTLGEYFQKQLNNLKLVNNDLIVDVRGMGFIIGVELNQPCSKLVEDFRHRNILVNCTSNNTIRILPPLISTKEHIDHFIKVFKQIL